MWFWRPLSYPLSLGNLAGAHFYRGKEEPLCWIVCRCYSDSYTLNDWWSDTIDQGYRVQVKTALVGKQCDSLGKGDQLNVAGMCLSAYIQDYNAATRVYIWYMIWECVRRGFPCQNLRLTECSMDITDLNLHPNILYLDRSVPNDFLVRTCDWPNVRWILRSRISTRIFCTLTEVFQRISLSEHATDRMFDGY
jgi:hypothetical protein